MPESSLFERVISVEVAITLAAMLLTFWGGYTVLADDQEEQAKEILAIKTQQSKISETVQAIRTDIAIVRTEQKYFKEEVESVKSDIKAIRSLLEQRYNEQ